MDLFVNGFRSWTETYYEVVSFIAQQKLAGRFEDLCHLDSIDLALRLTNQFEITYEGKDWGGEFLETIYDFCETETKEM